MSANDDPLDWSRWEHAYGPATDVPGWLDRIAGSDPADALAALEELEAAVNHQGWASPAAVPTAPRLGALVRARRGPLARLVVLLGDLAAQGSHANFPLTGVGPDDVAEEYRPARSAIADADLVATFSELLSDENGAVRAAVAIPLGVLVEHAGVTLPALRTRLAREKVKEPLACAVLAVGLLHAALRQRQKSPPDRDGDIDAVRGLVRHRTAIVKLASATALVQMDPSRERALALLALARPSSGRSLDHAERGVPWNGGRLAQLAVTVAVDALGTLGELSALVDAIDTIGASPVVEPLLRSLFGEPDYRGTEIRLVRALPVRAKAALQSLASFIARAGQAAPHVITVLLESYGLFDLPRQVGLVPPRPLDGDHDGEPRWVIARRVRDGRGDIAEWSRCLDAMTEEELLDVAKDLAMAPFPYRLPWRWRTPTEAEGGSAFGYGYDGERGASEAYHALEREVFRRLPVARLEECLSLALERRWTSGLPELLETYLGARSPEGAGERFASLVPRLFDDLHATKEAVRRRAALVPPDMLRGIVDGMPFGLLVTAGRGGRPHVYLRQAFLVADLCPSPALAERALAQLASLPSLYPDGYAAHGEALVDEAVSELVRFFHAFGHAFGSDVVRASCEQAAKRAAPQLATVLERVAAGLAERGAE
jgi:hypothetical protein